LRCKLKFFFLENFHLSRFGKVIFHGIIFNHWVFQDCRNIQRILRFPVGLKIVDFSLGEKYSHCGILVVIIQPDVGMKKEKGARAKSSIHIAITGGETAGHVYAGIAVAKEIKRQIPSAKILFIGTEKGMEAKIVPQEGFTLEMIEIRGGLNKSFGNTIKSLSRVPREVLSALKLLRKFQPSVVLGIGGYVSVPVIYAAYLLHVPTMILESNRQPGLANRLLSRSVDKIAIGFEESLRVFPKKKVILTGNPVRREFYLIGETPPPDKGRKLNILVIGGNRGARSMNYSLIAALDYLKAQRDRLTFTHQTGNTDFTYVRVGYEKRQFRAEVYQYIKDIPKMYARAHLVICRAGATTIAELKVSGRPSILIPYPYDDRHQEFNALALQEDGMAKIIAQPQLTGKSLAEAILQILENPEELAQVWPNTRQFREKDATEQVVQACLQLATGKDLADIEA